MSINWVETIALMVVGLLVVFLALVLLIIVISIVGKVFVMMGKNGGSKEERQQKKLQKQQEKLDKKKEKLAPKPVTVAKGVPNEVVAAISAAIAAVMGEGNFSIKKIKRTRKQANNWARAGAVENTRSFFN